MKNDSTYHNIPNRGDIAILWSHNEKKYPKWLDTIMKSSKSESVWWDVRWKLVPDRFTLPITGYIWNTVEQQTTHRASIEKIERQPSKQRADEVIRSWHKCNIHVNPDSPILLYLENRISTCTLLKLTHFERLAHPGNLDDFILAKKGRPIKQAPQSVAMVIDPYL